MYCQAHEESDVCTINRIQAELWRNIFATLVLEEELGLWEEVTLSPDNWDIVRLPLPLTVCSPLGGRYPNGYMRMGVGVY